MKSSLQDHFQALNRLKVGSPIRVPKGSKISNDSVALEAGRGKGSIKKSRPVFADLIVAIDAASTEHSKGRDLQKEKLEKVKSTSSQWRQDLEAALVREISLLREVFLLKKKLAKLTGSKVLPLRPTQRAD